MALTRLSDNEEFHVVAGEPTLIGYTFCNEVGDRLGDVEDLIADTDVMKVRFLVVSLDLGLLTSRKIIVPMRDISVDAAAERVVCSNCSEERLQTYPTFEGGELPDLEKRFTATFLPATGAPEPQDWGPAELPKEPMNRTVDRMRNDATTAAEMVNAPAPGGSAKPDSVGKGEGIDHSTSVGKTEQPGLHEGGHKHEGGCCGSLEAIDEGGVIFERRRDLPPL